MKHPDRQAERIGRLILDRGGDGGAMAKPVARVSFAVTPFLGDGKAGQQPGGIDMGMIGMDAAVDHGDAQRIRHGQARAVAPPAPARR